MSESPEVAVEGQDEERRPEWLPAKFSSPEAFGKSYAELEAKLTQTSQQNKEQAEQFEAYLAQEPRAESPTRGQTLANMQRLTEEAAYRSARQVVDAISSNRVPAPEDPEMLASVASRVMVSVDPAWAATDPNLVASVLESRPELLSEERLHDMKSVVSDLSTAAALARGIQSEQTLQAYQRAESARDMKRNAQTLTGAGGRAPSVDDDEAAFERIQAAHGKTWSNSRS